jgi:hypothetical protein
MPLQAHAVVPIITSTMLRIDPATHTVWFTDSPRCPPKRERPASLPRLLAAVALAGVVARVLELAVGATRR